MPYYTCIYRLEEYSDTAYINFDSNSRMLELFSADLDAYEQDFSKHAPNEIVPKSVCCEIDFLIDNGQQVIPMEVKAEINLKAKSLKTYRDKYNPKLSVRTSMADFKKEENLINLPLYAITEVKKVITNSNNNPNNNSTNQPTKEEPTPC